MVKPDQPVNLVQIDWLNSHWEHIFTEVPANPRLIPISLRGWSLHFTVVVIARWEEVVRPFLTLNPAIFNHLLHQSIYV